MAVIRLFTKTFAPGNDALTVNIVGKVLKYFSIQNTTPTHYENLDLKQ